MHKPEHSPHPWQRPNYYGAKTHFASLPDAYPALDAADKTHILEILGTLLFYARAIDSMLLTAIGKLTNEQSQAPKATLEKLTQLLNYCASHPVTTVQFTASDMILTVKSDASYLSVVKGCPCAAGYFFLTNKPAAPNAGPYKSNGAIQIMRELLLSEGHRSGIGSLVPQWQRSMTPLHCLQRNGRASTTRHHAHGDRQQHWLQAASQPTPSNKNGRKLMTCIFIGSAIKFAKANFKFIGAKARPMGLTTFPNITGPHLIRPFVPPCNCTHLLQTLHGTTLSVFLTRHLHCLHQLPVQSLSLSILAPLVRVCYHPRGTRKNIVTASQSMSLL